MRERNGHGEVSETVPAGNQYDNAPALSNESLRNEGCLREIKARSRKG